MIFEIPAAVGKLSVGRSLTLLSISTAVTTLVTVIKNLRKLRFSMPDEESDVVGFVGVDVELVSGGEGVSQSMVVSTRVPFAADPADGVEVVESGEFGKDQVLGAFAVELEQVDLR